MKLHLTLKAFFRNLIELELKGTGFWNIKHKPRFTKTWVTLDTEGDVMSVYDVDRGDDACQTQD